MACVSAAGSCSRWLRRLGVSRVRSWRAASCACKGAVDVALVAQHGQPRLVGEELGGQRPVVVVGRGQGEVEDEAAMADQQVQLEAVDALLLATAPGRSRPRPTSGGPRRRGGSRPPGPARCRPRTGRAPRPSSTRHRRRHDRPADAIGDLDQTADGDDCSASAPGSSGKQRRVVAPHVGQEARLRRQPQQLRRQRQGDQLAVGEGGARPRPRGRRARRPPGTPHRSGRRGRCRAPRSPLSWRPSPGYGWLSQQHHPTRESPSWRPRRSSTMGMEHIVFL